MSRQPVTDVDLPAGVRYANDWQPDDPQPYRVIMGTQRTVENANGGPVIVWSAAVQWRDGTVDDGEIEAPNVWLDAKLLTGLTSAQARQLAGILHDAADEIDGWTAAYMSGQ